MRLRDILQNGSRALMAHAKGRGLVHGAVRIEDSSDGWVRPWRLSGEQVRALGSCMAWHPGLYRQMARATSGICLEFVTDSSEVAFEVRLDGEPSGTRAALEDVDRNRGEEGIHDGLSADVDGRHLSVRLPREGDDYVTFALDDPDDLPAGGAQRLPGFGGSEHHARIWLPALRGCEIRDLIGNGTYIKAVDERDQLLVLGDSIAQGFCSDDPGLAWPQLLATDLGLDVVNQGIGGQVFQPGSLLGLAALTRPAHIVVELGENYRYEPCRSALVTRDIRTYLSEVARLWPDTPTWVLTPLWHDEQAYPSHAMSCWRDVPSFIEAHAAPYAEMRLVDGSRLLDHDSTLLADGYEHPDAAGSRQIAGRLGLVMQAGSGASHEELREAALAALEHAPERAFPLAECVRRDNCDIIVARPGCVAARTRNGDQLLWASDHELGKLVISTLLESTLVTCLEPALVRDVRDSLGLSQIIPYHLAICEDEGPLPVEGRDIRPLGPDDFLVVRQHYAHPELVSDERLAELLAEGRFLGGYEDGELVGFVGEHEEGSIGMLEVFEGHRRQGWGRELEAAKANRQLAAGMRPWCEVWTNNKASKALQKSLGFKVTPANEQCYLSKPFTDAG